MRAGLSIVAVVTHVFGCATPAEQAVIQEVETPAQVYETDDTGPSVTNVSLSDDCTL